MAAGGIEECGSVKESDFLYDFPCSPCDEDGRNVEAIKYCLDCNENLCGTCLTHHNRFAMTRGHTVLDQVQTNQGQTTQLLSQRCSKHDGKIIDVFCPEHNIVGCSTCIAFDHRSCKGKTFIPDAAVGFRTSQELENLQTQMKILESKLNELKKLKGDTIQCLKQEKEALKKEIQSVRKKMNEELDKMEKMLVGEAEAKVKHKIDVVQASIGEVDDLLVRVKQYMDTITSDSNDADVFVSCKIVKHEMSSKVYSLYAKVKERLPERSFELHTSQNAKLIMEGKSMFASINEKYTIQRAEYKQDITISARKPARWIFSMCALPDGCLAIADYDNRKLKKLDTVSNIVSTLIKLPDSPCGLCLVDDGHLAVSLVNLKKIQFVSLSRKIELKNSFSTGDRCRSMAYCDGLLYVGCGGAADRKEEGPGHVEVYNCNGKLLRCVSDMCRPDYISVINDGFNTTMYISEFNAGIVARDLYGNILRRFPDTPANTFVPFCVIGTDQICIGECTNGHTFGNIYIQTYKKKHILVNKDTVKGVPISLYFDQRSSRLFVALSSNIIQVFGLHTPYLIQK